MKQLAVVPPASRDVTKVPPTHSRLAGLAHALHDGFTDMIYVLLPVWQAQFALGYSALAVLRALYVGALAALQVPSGHLARHLNARTILVLGTLLSAAGFASVSLAGSSDYAPLSSWRAQAAAQASTCFLRCVACLRREGAWPARHI